MDTNIAQKIARAFVHGLAFAKGMATLAQDAKAKMEEGDKWITIGAEPGDDGKKHGGRHVLISGTGEVKAGLSKSAQGKPLGEAVKELKDKAESKKAESAPETHAYSAKELDSMKQKQEGRLKAKKENAELNRKLKEGEKAGNIRFPRNEFRDRAKVYTEQANQVINDDLKPSVDKLGSAIRKNTDNARMPQSTLDDLNDIHNLAKQIGPMANKLNKYNEKYAAEHDDPSNYVISNYGAATKGTAERAASLARRAAAMSNQLTAPDDERDYSEGRAKQEIRDILEEMRGLHGDLLKKTRHAATAFNTESAPLQGAQTKERTGTSTREPSVSREVPKSFDLSTKEIKDLTDKLRDYTDDRTGSYEFGRKLQDMANLSAEIDKMDKMDKRYLSSMAQHNLEAARHHLGLAAKAARAVDNYQWRGAIPSLRTEITRRLNTANRLYQEALTESDRVDAMYTQKGSKPKQRIIN